MNIVTTLQHALLRVGAAPVLWLMLFLSILSVAVMLERMLFFRRVHVDIDKLSSELGRSLRAGDRAAAEMLLARSLAPAAIVAAVGLSQLARGAHAVREAMASAELLQRARLERRISYLGTLGANAPFIGLFGTVIGIIMAFDELSEQGARAAASAAVMASIAEALVATAVGIAVAVPAIVAFNAFQRHIRSIADQTQALGHVVLASADDGAGTDNVLRASSLALAQRTRASEV